MAPRSATDRDIAQLAAFYGWRHHCSSPVLTVEGRNDGFPPHVLLRGPRLVFITCAPGRGHLLRAEEEWCAGLDQAREVEAMVISEEDLRELTCALRGARSAGLPTQDARPGRRSGRRNLKAPTRQEEACTGTVSS